MHPIVTLEMHPIVIVMVCLFEAALIAGLVVERFWRKRAQRAVFDRLRFEGLVGALSSQLERCAIKEIDRAIEAALKQIRDFFRSDRCGLLEVQEGYEVVHFAHDSSPAGSEHLSGEMNLVPKFPWMHAQVVKQEHPIGFAKLSELPPEAEVDRQSWLAAGVKSCLGVPLRIGNRVRYVLAMDGMRKVEDWPEKPIVQLRLLGEILANAVERKEADHALRESEATEAAIFESMRSGLVVLNRSSEIVKVNSAWRELAIANGASGEVGAGIGIDYSKVCQQTLRTGASEAAEVVAGVQAILSNSVIFFETEFASDSPEGKHWFQVSMTPLKTAAGGAVLIHRDITPLKQAAIAICESESRFRVVANSAPVLIRMSGPDMSCTYFNKTWLDFTGRPLEQELGDGWMDGVHPDDREMCFAACSAAGAAHREFNVEFRLRRFDGKYRWIFGKSVPRFDSEGLFLGFIGSCIDITDRRMLEERLREISGRLITAQEQERSRIARDLHDDVSQRLALLSIGLDQLKRHLPERSTLAMTQLREIAQMVDGVSSDIHALSHDLHPSKLDTLGLVAAINGYCRELLRQHVLQVRFEHHDIPAKIPRNITLCLYRVVQEALRNVAKHSGVTDARVELGVSRGGIHLSVSDQGGGFDLAHPNQDEGLGLISMRERLRLVNGEVSIHSAQSRGTQLDVWIPLSTPTKQSAEDLKALRVSA